MLRTPLCDVLGIEIPILLAPMGSATSAEFAAAVSNQGGLGGIGSLFRATTAIKRDIDVMRNLTNRPMPSTTSRSCLTPTLPTRWLRDWQ
jgi:NAD(P)H-dependent flavin oxidoreductase YrpB (nitropropane dioxygenase family)